MATIRKRSWVNSDGSTSTKWMVDYKDQSGKRRFKNFNLKKEADEWLVKARSEVQQGVHTARRDSLTVEKAAEDWIAKGEAEKLQRSTLKSYRELARLHIVPLIGHVRLSDLTAPMVADFRSQLIATLSKPMAAKALSSLSSIISTAQEAGKVSQNVARELRVKRASTDKPHVEIPTRSELRAMIASADPDWLAFVMVAVATGLRSSELRGLPWNDVDLTKGTIAVSQRADQWGVIGPPKSKAGRRSIPIPPEVITALSEWKLRCKASPAGLVWPSASGTPYRHNNLLRRMFIPLQVKAGICEPRKGKSGEVVTGDDGDVEMTGRYGFHALRHAAASNWIDSGVDLKRLQAWLGHANIQITLDTYGHLMADADRDAELAMRASRGVFGQAA